MNTIQPLLIPTTGTLADLHVSVDPSSPTELNVYWGTVLLQRVPKDKNSVLFRLFVGLLLNLKFRIGGIAKAFGVSEKPLRVWRDAVKNGDCLSLGASLDGLSAKRKLRTDVERYIRASYRQACDSNDGRMPYGFRKQLCKQVLMIWPDQAVSEETLRQLFRDEDAGASSVKIETTKEPHPTVNAGELIDSDSNSPQEDSLKASSEKLSCHADSEYNRKSSPGFSGDLRSDDEENRESACDCCSSVRNVPDSPDTGVHRMTTEQLQSTSHAGEPASLTPCGSQSSSVVTADIEKLSGHPNIEYNRKSSPDLSDDLSSDVEENREWDCDSTEPHFPPRNSPITESDRPPDRPEKCPPKQRSFPLLHGDGATRPFTSQHAGLLLLASEFDETFGLLPPILRQTGAQILVGCVNQEQGKLIDTVGLSKVLGKMIRDLTRQRTLLDRLAKEGAEKLVYEGNIGLLKLRSSDELILYCDTNHSEYTGSENVLWAWSGRSKKALKGIMMEFFHTAEGQPCMIGHYDNFYDGRQRFFLLRQRWVELLQPWTGHFVWVHDRGYWSDDFLQQIVECGDIFIQWEKNYQEDGWDETFQQDGSFSMVLLGNNSHDQRTSAKIKYQEQKWDRFTNGRRFIVRIQRASTPPVEIAIVTNHPTMPAEEVIRLMLRRFLQENDFSYLNRHVGIHELTARKFDRYPIIAHQLQDRDGRSRIYKKTKKDQLALQEKLKQCLFKLDRLTSISLAALEKKRAQLRQQSDRLDEQLARLDPAEVSDTVLCRFTRKLGALRKKYRRNSDQRAMAQDRQKEQAKRGELRRQIEEVNQQLTQVARTESRLLMLIEEKYVRPNMDRKIVVDAVRITARNIFCQALNEFRPQYNNYRDDHVVLRALTHSAGTIIPHQDRIDVYLLPRLDRQPEEWERIENFLRDREKRIEQRFERPVRFLVGRSDEQIFAAVERARRPMQ